MSATITTDKSGSVGTAGAKKIGTWLETEKGSLQMFWRVAPDVGYCLFFPDRPEGRRFIAGQRVRVWPFEQFKHIKLGIAHVVIPEHRGVELYVTANGDDVGVVAAFDVVVGGPSGGREERMARASISLPPSSDLSARTELSFFRDWASNHCRGAIQAVIHPHTSTSLLADAEARENAVREITDVARASLDSIGLILVKSDVRIERLPNASSVVNGFGRRSELRTADENLPSRTAEGLRVFICHASSDKSSARNLHHRLMVDHVDPWLDEERLLPGQDWDDEIRMAIRASHAVIVCLSTRSVDKRGYVQKEIAYALDAAAEQPDRTIFLIPAKLEDCEVPNRLTRWQWVDLHHDDGYAKLLDALRRRGASLKPRPIVPMDRGKYSQ